MWFCDLVSTMMHNQFALQVCLHCLNFLPLPPSQSASSTLLLLPPPLHSPPPPPPCSVSHSPHFVLSVLLSFLPTTSALRSCSTGDSLLSSAFIRSAKSAPALAPPLPVLLHHHHPLLPPLADQLAGTHSLHYLPALLLSAR